MRRIRLLFLTLLAACGVDVTGDCADVSDETAALGGDHPNASFEHGWAAIAVAGDPNIHTGILISPNLVLVSSRVLPDNVLPNNLKVFLPVSSTTLAEQPVRAVQRGDGQAYIHVAPTGVPPTRLPALDDRANATPVGTDVVCRSFYGDPAGAPWSLGLGQVRMRVRGNGNFLAIGTIPPIEAISTGFLEGQDLGAPCHIPRAGQVPRLIGIADSVEPANERATLFSGSLIAPALGSHQFLADLVDAKRAGADVVGPYRLQALTNGTLSYLNIPGSNWVWSQSLELAPSSGALSQRWYIDRRGTSFARIVSASSGMCVDLPWGVVPNRIGQYPCNGAPNQGWSYLVTIMWSAVHSEMAPTTSCLVGTTAETSQNCTFFRLLSDQLAVPPPTLPRP